MHAIHAIAAGSPDEPPAPRIHDPGTSLLTLEELAARLPSLQPPAAYRLSLDSGVGYKNVRRAFEQPMAIRLHTWERLLRSLRIRMLASAQVADPGQAATANAVGLLPGTADAGGLRRCRLNRGWSRRELAQRAGVGTDAIASLEAGCGRLGTLARVCDALGLALRVALPPGYRSLEHLWEDRAAGCLAAPAQFPPARPRRPAARATARLRSATQDRRLAAGAGRE